MHEGAARSSRSSATFPTRKATTSSSRAARPTASCPRASSVLVFTSPGLIEIPRRYRNEYGQLLEHAPYYHRDLHAPTELRTHTDRGEHVVKLRIKDGFERTCSTTTRSTSSAGTATSTRGPSTSATSSRSPGGSTCHRRRTRPSRAGTSSSARSARVARLRPRGDPDPYHHSNLNSEEMIYYVDGNFSSRKGIEVGSVTLHPSGIPHGPHPGLAEGR